MLDARNAIEHGDGFWNHETKEIVFYQPEYDDKDSTYTLGRACWSKGLGVQADNIRYDEDIDRDKAVERILREYGWISVSDPLTRVYGPMVLGEFEE